MEARVDWSGLSHLFVIVVLSNFVSVIVTPAITDVTLAAVCPGKDECSLAIYLTGFQQAVTGFGAVFIMPLLGNLSDVYGGKSVLTVPLLASIFPSLILAIKRTKYFFYAYYVLKILTAMVAENGVVCLGLAYLADSVPKKKRVSAFGVLSGIVSAGLVCGTVAARILSTAQIFQVAAATSIFATMYMIAFLKDTTHPTNAQKQPLLTSDGVESGQALGSEVSNKPSFIRTNHILSPKDVFYLFKRSITFSLAAFVAFFNNFGQAGVQASMLYFLKDRFHYQKDQFADVQLIGYLGGTLSNILLMPLLGPALGEEILLSIGLFGGFVMMLLNSIAWSSWVPYAAALNGVLLYLANPNICTIFSKHVSPDEQGIAQGCLFGISSFAGAMSPLIFSPLTALFLSEEAPFKFPGFSVLCLGLAWLIGCIISLVITFLSRKKINNVGCEHGSLEQ